MNDGVQLAQDASSRDPAIGLRAVRALRELAERLETLQVRNARDLGWSWQEIATVLGVSRQAVHKKHRGVDEQRPGWLPGRGK
ncbi:helix-turn-helix domain-containing protein [Actinocorallia longicatena]|uniref:Sigma factor-like helix-turn-helix DNA-binding protein n=1 Tax=Actinocorallia longicatena TaxID=111803 RepID=A0ABP6Q8X8_9ACTN